MGKPSADPPVTGLAGSLPGSGHPDLLKGQFVPLPLAQQRSG